MRLSSGKVASEVSGILFIFLALHRVQGHTCRGSIACCATHKLMPRAMNDRFNSGSRSDSSS